MDECILNAIKVEFREFCVIHLTLRAINDIFAIYGFEKNNSSISGNGERRTLVEEYYASSDWRQEETVCKFFRVIEHVLGNPYFLDDAKDDFRSKCRNFGIEFEENGYKIVYEKTNTTFCRQFPVGLPFGVPKPRFSVKAKQGGQSLQFELQDGLGIILPENEVYPNLDFKKLEGFYGVDSSTNRVLKMALFEMNQTECEKTFFDKYARRYGMGKNSVPILIPQAWIQWHSHNKRSLRSSTASHQDEIYRVDFVAFWNNKRYVILVDDISHYAKKEGQRWMASEEAYSNRLKEDRKLRNEKWEVFRVSNWEMRDDSATQEILEDLRSYIGFDFFL